MQKGLTNTNSRSRSEIVIQILEAVNDYGEDRMGIIKTTLTYEIFLSSNQLKEYLAALIAHGLLHYDSATHAYNTTKTGLRSIDLWYKMRDMVEEQLYCYYN
jgi:predicted transcriptional regulator